MADRRKRLSEQEFRIAASFRCQRLSSRCSVEIPNEWANPNGQSVQHVRAKIIIETRSLDAAPNNTTSLERPKL
ncbi:MAG: hypothetical protein ACLQGP_42570 [Isosphaeraceae bacterium]